MSEATITESLTSTTAEKLKQIADAVNKLEEDKKALSEDIKAKFAEAATFGFDVKALKAAMKALKQSEEERTEFESIVELYMAALDPDAA